MDRSKIGIIAAACGGLAGGALLGAPLLSSASPGTPPSTTATSIPTDDNSTTTDDMPGDKRARADRTDHRDRADKCRDGRGGGGGGRKGHGRMHGRRGNHLFLVREAIAELLGIEREELRTRIRDGETIAEIAVAEGLDPQDVIDTLVEEAQANLDERLERRSEILEERVTDLVNGELRDRNDRDDKDETDGD
ncbi:MAG: hypothetical protein M3501_09570 [Actinomycetota bacterium]|nr:hypothetical protein [Actinomycetota bacterium]